MQIKKIEEKCNSCGLCVKDCVAGVWRDTKGVAEVAAPQLCSFCGHCLAVCPKDAIVHEGLDLSQVRKVDKNRLDPAVFREVVLGRRSIRRYRQGPVPEDVIADILDLSAFSPTASNKQDVAYTVITDPGVLGAVSETVFGIGRKLYNLFTKWPGKWVYGALNFIAPGNDLARYMEPMPYYLRQVDQDGRDLILHNAPVLILAHAPKKGRFHCENCNIAAANIMNDAHVRGLGTCYIGFLVLALKFSPFLRKQVQVARHRRVYACLVMGYPAYGYGRIPPRRRRTINWI